MHALQSITRQDTMLLRFYQIVDELVVNQTQQFIGDPKPENELRR